MRLYILPNPNFFSFSSFFTGSVGFSLPRSPHRISSSITVKATPAISISRLSQTPSIDDPNHRNPNSSPPSILLRLAAILLRLIMVSAKSRSGRGGSSGRSRKHNSETRNTESPKSRNPISSTSSRRLDTNSSPPSVGTRQIQHPPSAERRHVPQGSNTAFVPPPVNTTLFQHPAHSRASSQRPNHQLEAVDQPEPQGVLSPPFDDVHSQDEDEEEDEDEDDGDDIETDSSDDSDSDHRRTEGQMTLDQLLSTDRLVDRLSPIRGEGLWFTRNKSKLTKKISRLLKDKFDGCWIRGKYWKKMLLYWKSEDAIKQSKRV